MTGRLLLTLALVVLVAPSAAPARAQFNVVPMMVNGSTSGRINIVFMAEGYTAGEMATFATDAQDALSYLLTLEPWSAYAPYFNAYRIEVVSSQSGSDHPGTASDEPGGVPVFFADTYFNSTYDYAGIHRLLAIPDPGAAYSLLINLFPEWDVGFVVVNKDIYGGSGGMFAVFSTHSASAELAAHEVGHSFAFLDDEYPYGDTGYWDTDAWPNTTVETVRASIKWNAWIDPATPVPTPAQDPYLGVVGLFQGAHYNPTRWYRPKADCRMRSLGVPFCPVCAEALVRSYYRLLHPIVSSTAPADVDSVFDADSLSFEVTTLEPAAHSIALAWKVDAVPQPGTANTFVLHGGPLAPGTHTVVATAHDPTSYVRTDPPGLTDPDGLLTETRTWYVEKVLVASVPPFAGRGPRLVLHASVPNPVTGAARLRFELRAPAGDRLPVRLALHAVDGRRVRLLEDRALPAGVYERPWDGSDEAGRPVRAGVYFLSASAGGAHATRRVVVVR